jgi:hypothetical protein
MFATIRFLLAAAAAAAAPAAIYTTFFREFKGLPLLFAVSLPLM